MAWATFTLIFIVFLEVASPQFIMQFDVRPNRLFIEYLSYPDEVLATLWHGFRIALVVGVAFTVLCAVLIYKLLKAASANLTLWRPARLLLVWPLLVVLLFVQIRSTTAHPSGPRPLVAQRSALPKGRR